MSEQALRRIRAAIVAGTFDLTRHAVEEMAEDGLTLADVESAMLTGEITKVDIDDLRGPRYTVVGLCDDGSSEVGVVGRFTETGAYLVITVYETGN